jgi:hypothetical protein
MYVSRLVLCAVSLVLAAPVCPAAAITNIQVTNNSSPSFLDMDAIRVREFRTEFAVPADATVSANTATFTSRFAWTSGQRVFPGPSGLPLTHGNTVAYDLIFTVEDPSSVGYDLTLDSSIRGYLTALWEDNVGIFPSLVFASGTLMAATLDDGGGFGPMLTGINTDIEVASATPASPFSQVLVARSGTYAAGHYTGTRTFTLRYSTLADNTGVGLQNYNIGEGNVRFGLDTASPFLRNGSYPGVDGEAAAGHGHFVTVTADFGTAAVPEPTTFSAMTVALCAAAFFMKKKG